MPSSKPACHKRIPGPNAQPPWSHRSGRADADDDDLSRGTTPQKFGKRLASCSWDARGAMLLLGTRR
ncbi:hypothetical protein EYF80_023429 [Liparis tanakae]|uniref:Uncharacterized protein n=1 Tax=Liparis tanakae TaxID=230148 RepID=A0A4Z2HLF7_9TELE|nr:hypothetical protein EYF80_023429 [Liparis tanakae]